MTLRLVIADDEALIRQGLRMVLENDAEIEIVGEAADGVEAIALVRDRRPDVALLDIRMPRTSGLDAARWIVQDPALRHVRVIMLTTFAEDELVAQALRAGAAGYLLKSMPPEQIRAAVRAVAGGTTMLAPELMERLVRAYTRRHVPRSPVLDRLTPRETEVLRQVAAGSSNREIARALHLGEGTVKTHVAAVLRKLGVRDRTEAAVAAYELGLVTPGG